MDILLDCKCNQRYLKGTGMIVNRVRFFVAMIVVGMIGMICETWNESRVALHEQRMQQRMLENKQE